MNKTLLALLGITIFSAGAAYAADLPQITINKPPADVSNRVNQLVSQQIGSASASGSQDTDDDAPVLPKKQMPQLGNLAKGEQPAKKKEDAPAPKANIEELYDPTKGMTVPDISAAETTDDSQVVLPEITQKVILSVTDINRIVCPAGNIPEIPTSQEKGIKISYFGKNATVKFQYEKIDGKEVYPKRPIELVVPCGDSVYQLIAYPKKVEMQTIRLSSGRDQKVRDNFEVFKGMPYEQKITQLIKAAYTDDIASSFEVATPNTPVKLYRDLGITLVRTIAATGTGLSLKEYYVTITKKDLNLVELKERDFFRVEIGKHVVAVAIDKLKLAAGAKARVFAVEFGEDGK